MQKPVSALLCLVLLLSVIHVANVDAADEDTQASVYLVFDPDTGEFVTVDDPNLTSQHKAQLDQEAIESVIDIEDGAGKLPLTWPIGAALIALLLGVTAWVWRCRQRAA